MNLENKIRILEMAYAGALADTVYRLSKEGILEKVTEEKRKEQMLSGKRQAEMFGITKPEEVFTRLSEIFNCAVWDIQQDADGFSAEAKGCKLCAIAKKFGAGSPCGIYCLNPMEGMIKGLNPDSQFNVKETLWDGAKCRVEVVK